MLGIWPDLLFMLFMWCFFFVFKSFCILAEFLFVVTVIGRGMLISHCVCGFVCFTL